MLHFRDEVRQGLERGAPAPGSCRDASVLVVKQQNGSREWLSTMWNEYTVRAPTWAMPTTPRKQTRLTRITPVAYLPELDRRPGTGT
jgi:hypothetical protein